MIDFLGEVEKLKLRDELKIDSHQFNHIFHYIYILLADLRTNLQFVSNKI